MEEGRMIRVMSMDQIYTVTNHLGVCDEKFILDIRG